VESESNPRLLLYGFFACVVTAGLMYFGNGLNPSWPLVWLGPLPVLWFALRSPWKLAAPVAALAWLAGCLNLWTYFRVLGMPAIAWLGVFGLPAILFALAVLLFRALVLRDKPFTALVSLPAAWVTFEYLRNLIWPHGTAGSLAYSQLSFLPFLQTASLGGPWAITFFLLLFPVGIAITLHLQRTVPWQARPMLTVTLAPIALLFIFGIARLAIPQPGPLTRVGLVAADKGIAPAGPATLQLIQAYANQAQALAAHGAQAVVLPEKLGTLTDATLPATDALLQQTANRSHAIIIAGFDREATGVAYNQARVYRPGLPVASYDKEHLLPPFELKFTPGTSLLLLQIAPQPWAIAICKDMDFIQPSRTYGRDHVGLMLVPAWDFNLDRAWHGHIAIMRGVEDGFSIARAAKNGYLTVSDNRGRILAQSRSDAAPFSTLLAQVPSGHSFTLFQFFGNWFAWLALALCAWTVFEWLRPSAPPASIPGRSHTPQSPPAP
jgi:apolipoprotein N-acyltransferase